MVRPGLNMALRQILAILERERQALAGLDISAMLECASEKDGLCADLDAHFQSGAPSDSGLSEEQRSLLEAARRRNAINRQIRNLLAANVAARLESMAGMPALYHAKQAARPATSTAPLGASAHGAAYGLQLAEQG